MSKSKDILGPMRVPFLILTPACVLLGIATAVRSGVHIQPTSCHIGARWCYLHPHQCKCL